MGRDLGLFDRAHDVGGPCVAGGAYLPALSDVIFMVEGTSFMGLGGPNLVKGATGQVVDGEMLGGAVTHTAVSAVAPKAHTPPETAPCTALVTRPCAVGTHGCNEPIAPSLPSIRLLILSYRSHSMR